MTTAQTPTNSLQFFGGAPASQASVALLTGTVPTTRITTQTSAGLDTVIFDSPGQGTVLDAGTPMTPDWHLPTAAILDYFQLTGITLLGFSLGGGLVIRAAAREPRISRVIAMDICTEFFEAATRGFSASGLSVIAANSGQIPAPVVNAAVAAAGKTDLLTDWVIAQGERVMGVTTAADVFQAWREYRTADVSSRVTQDVLLMAGAKDHYMPLHPRLLRGVRTASHPAWYRSKVANNVRCNGVSQLPRRDPDDQIREWHGYRSCRLPTTHLACCRFLIASGVVSFPRSAATRTLESTAKLPVNPSSGGFHGSLRPAMLDHNLATLSGPLKNGVKVAGQLGAWRKRARRNGYRSVYHAIARR